MTTFDKIVERLGIAVPELTNSSHASIWRRFAAVIGIIIDAVLLEMNRSEDIVEYAARNLRVMGKEYYRETALAYQEGDDVEVVDPATLREGYSEIDESKRIIKQVSVESSSTGEILVKVSTTDAEGNLVALTADQLSGFVAYYEHFTPLGIFVLPSSQPPDVLRANRLQIRYDSGYSLQGIQAKLVEALKNFQLVLKTDSPVYINDIEKTLREIPGIRDAYFESPFVTYLDDIGTEQSVQPDGGRIPLHAGYFNFDPQIYDWEAGITIFTAVR